MWRGRFRAPGLRGAGYWAIGLWALGVGGCQLSGHNCHSPVSGVRLGEDPALRLWRSDSWGPSLSELSDRRGLLA